MPTPVYLNYKIKDGNNHLDATKVHTIKLMAADGEDQKVTMRNLLKRLFAVKNEDGTYDTSVKADYYLGEYDATGDDFIGFKESSEINTIQPILVKQATDAGWVTEYSNKSNIVVTFMRDANPSDAETDYFNQLVEYAKQQETVLQNKGFTQADVNADTVEYSCSHCIVINIPENGADYISVS